MARKSLKRYLMLLSAVGLLAIGTSGSGTFATFNAEVSNPGNYFATGTIFLHVTKSGGNTCKSEVDTTNNQNILSTNGCDALIQVNNLASGGTGSVALQLDNAGSINASKLQFALASACTQGKARIASISAGSFTGTLTNQSISVTPNLTQKLFSGTVLTLDNGTNTENVTLTADASSGASSIQVSGTLTNTYATGSKVEWGTQFGTPTSLCGQIQVVVEETDTLDGTATECLFGANAPTNAACTYDASHTINDIGTTLATNSYTVSGLGTSSNTTALDAGKTRFLRIGWTAPTFSNNVDQNNAANFGLKWHIEQ